jgi:glucose dehydrogenase
LLKGQPFVEVNWMSGLDEKGRPVLVPGRLDGPDKAAVRPLAGFGGTIWEPPSYSPGTGLFYIPAWDVPTVIGATPANAAYGAIRAFDPLTGERKWEFRPDMSRLATRIPGRFTGPFVGRFAGLLTTASGLLFTGVGDAYFYALDARTGELLREIPMPGRVYNAPMSYSVNGTQFIAIATGNTLFAFALRQ